MALADFSESLVKKYADELRIDSEDLAATQKLVGALVGSRLPDSEGHFHKVKLLLTALEQAFHVCPRDLQPQANNSLTLLRSFVLITKSLQELLYGGVDDNSPTALYLSSDGALGSCTALITMGSTADERLNNLASYDSASAANGAVQVLSSNITNHEGDANRCELLKLWMQFTTHVLGNMSEQDLPSKKARAEHAVESTMEKSRRAHQWQMGRRQIHG